MYLERQYDIKYLFGKKMGAGGISKVSPEFQILSKVSLSDMGDMSCI